MLNDNTPEGTASVVPAGAEGMGVGGKRTSAQASLNVSALYRPEGRNRRSVESKARNR
jgi:hypothetical protein